MAMTKAILEKWLVVRKCHYLSDRQIQTARELDLNPGKPGKIDNYRQEVWKTPFPQFTEDICFKRSKREEPETVEPLKQIMAEMEVKKKQQRTREEEQRKQRILSPGPEEQMI